MSLLSYWGILLQAKVNKKIQHVQLADPSQPAPMRSFSELYLTEMSDSVDIIIDERMAKDKKNLLRIIRRLIKKNKKLWIAEIVKTFTEEDIRYIYDMDNTVRFFTRYIDPKGALGSNQILGIDIDSYMLILDKLRYFTKICLSYCSSDLDKVVFTITNLARYITYGYSNNRTISCLTNGLLLKSGVCVDIAISFWKCLDSLNIDCIFVKGISNSRFSDALTYANHAWNQVKIDNNWYNIDLTWLITDSTEKFILASDEIFYDINSITDIIPREMKKELYKNNNTASNSYELHKTTTKKHPCPHSIDRDLLHKKIEYFKSLPNPFEDYDHGKR